MERRFSQFPIVSDNETVISPIKEMDLYDTGELITNIRQGYRRRSHLPSQAPVMTERRSERKFLAQKTELYSEPVYKSQSREIAKQDIKEKKRAYLTTDTKKHSFVLRQDKTPVSTKVSTEHLSVIGRAAAKLEQDEYILAEIPRSYRQPDNMDAAAKPKKNSYDFLKQSQIYNYPENQVRKERQVAQELNLTRFE